MLDQACLAPTDYRHFPLLFAKANQSQEGLQGCYRKFPARCLVQKPVESLSGIARFFPLPTPAAIRWWWIAAKGPSSLTWMAIAFSISTRALLSWRLATVIPRW